MKSRIGAVLLVAASAGAGSQSARTADAEQGRHQADAIHAIVPRYLEVAGPPGSVVAQVLVAGSPAPDGTAVSFTGSLGLSFSPVLAHTIAGLAEATVFPGSETGFAQIDVAAGTARASTTLWVRPGVPYRGTLSAAPPATAPGGTVSVSARIVDRYDNPVDGAAVRWDAVGGAIVPADGFVERGWTAATLTVGHGPVATARLTSGDAVAEISVPVAAEQRPSRLFVPFAATRAEACENIVRNPGFAEDRNGDRAPDGWGLVQGDGVAEVIDAGPARSGRALRMAAPDEGAAPEALQQWDLRAGLTGAIVRLWLRGDTGASLRLDVWSIGDLSGRPVRLPVLVETVSATTDWRLHVFALPAPPSGATDLRLSPRGAGTAVETTGIVLEVCP